MLKEWENAAINEQASWLYDRRNVDQDVFRRFRENGDVINMATSAAELTKDLNFWKTEEEVQKVAFLYMKETKGLRPFDSYNMKPDSYDIKAGSKHDTEGKKPTANDA